MSDYEIVQKFKYVKSIESDYKVAQLLRVNRVFISKVKTGKKDLSENLVRKMIKLAGEQGEVIADAWAKRSRDRVLTKLQSFIPAFWILSSIGMFSSKAAESFTQCRIMDNLV
jgi:hypothetical protein